MGDARYVYVVLGAAVAFGCGAPDEGGVASDVQNIKGAACSLFNNQTGREMTVEELAKLDDPIAKKLIDGNDCPTTYSASLAKLKRNDTADCVGGPDGLRSFLVSETAAFAPSGAQAARDGYRTVITKVCEKRDRDAMLFSGFANEGGVSERSVEMIGKDATTGVFNFYEVLADGTWVYYGNSFDFIGEGYACKPSGYCVSKNSRKASSRSRKSCASCHVGGGLVMKEIAAPWVHWTPNFPKGADSVVTKHQAKLGKEDVASTLEFVMNVSFPKYNEKRVSFLASKGVAELLRPLFCTMEINIDADFHNGGRLLTEVAPGSELEVDSLAYGELKREVRQRIIGAPPSVDDTAVEFAFPTKGENDRSYVSQLAKAMLIDEEFKYDVLSVDFTRPIFSGQRCALLGVIDGKTSSVDAKLQNYATEPDPERKRDLAVEIATDIPALFTAALSGRALQPAEEQFLRNLTDPTATRAAHRNAGNAFLQQCNARLSRGDAASRKAALKDIMTFAAHVRSVMRKDVVGFNGQDLLEGGGRDNKMVVDDIPDNPNALDPDNCLLALPPNAVKTP